ncbi:MAG: hypothetical protein PHS65_09380 [Arcobacteraceae bacterium]|nr:hypothetical protein [Arcobacteraceae bacterium]
MNSYDIFLWLLKILILGSMFFVLRGYGLRGLLQFTLLLLLIAIGLIYFFSWGKENQELQSSPQTSLNEKSK